MISELAIRPIERADEPEWRRLWGAYLTFYETALPEDVYGSTFSRLFEPGEFEPKGFLALKDGKPIGLVHYILHRTCWSQKNNCYLQDLYADGSVRGLGVGRALIEAVYAKADELQANNVYWMTQEHNATARLLYDRIAKRSGFIQYKRPA